MERFNEKIGNSFPKRLRAPRLQLRRTGCASARGREPGPVLTAFHQPDEGQQAPFNFVQLAAGEQAGAGCPIFKQMLFEGIHAALHTSGVTIRTGPAGKAARPPER